MLLLRPPAPLPTPLLTENESAVEEQVYGMNEGILQHQTWVRASNSWTQKRSPPQPNTPVTISAKHEDFRAHGQTLPQETHNLRTTAMADTSCQSCLAGPTLMDQLRST